MKECFEVSLKTYEKELREKIELRLENFLNSGPELSEDVAIEVIRFLVAEVAERVNFFSFVDTRGVNLEEARLIIGEASKVKMYEVDRAVEVFKCTIKGDIKQEYIVFLGNSACRLYIDRLSLNNCSAPALQYNKIINGVSNWELILPASVRGVIELRGEYLGEDVHMVARPISCIPTGFSHKVFLRLREGSKAAVNVSKSVLKHSLVDLV